MDTDTIFMGDGHADRLALEVGIIEAHTFRELFRPLAICQQNVVVADFGRGHGIQKLARGDVVRGKSWMAGGRQSRWYTRVPFHLCILLHGHRR